MKKCYIGLLALMLLMACNSQKTVIAPPVTEVETEVRNLDTMTVTAPMPTEIEEIVEPSYSLPVYNPSYTQEHDLLHTQLDIRFDWEKEQVIGKAKLRLKPYFYPSQSLTLDAKGFSFNKVSMTEGGADLKYDYDDQQITIQLPREYTRDEEYEIYIDYVATPAQSGGSAAITSDKGLFFINPRGEDPDKPQQIWTQGETENNSRWFPTIDKPNERCTQDLSVTVEDKFKTLSNGNLVSSTKNSDGSRTDRWVMEQDHAPYLFMLAIGDFARVEDESWEGIPVDYYVEHEYEEYAKDIFPYTPEMLGFFSKVTGVKYPWAKYSQVAVRDYVSGAMENTTAVIFGEFMQGTDRELIDVDINEKIVAHEMFHHWFGDYVTCESWANLTLQEGFANYSEYLWMEYKHGRDAADYHLLQEWSGYIGSSRQQGIHPLIHYSYDDKEDMFDAHSYNKGGAVLHMLRHEVGDDAFFASLNKYLVDNAFSAVEVDELRMAFEETTGRDLQWFFDQWYLAAGHPELEVSYEYIDGEAKVNVKQNQNPEGSPPIFQLPVAIDIYTEAGQAPMRKKVTMTEREQTFSFPTATEPKLMIFDADRMLLAERANDKKSDEQLLFQFYNAPRLLDRFEAIQKLEGSDNPGVKQMLIDALDDPFYAIRQNALAAISEDPSEAALAKVRALAKKDPHSGVQATALSLLGEMEDEQVASIAESVIKTARAYPVVAAALSTLAQLDPAKGLGIAKEMEKESSPQIIAALGDIYAASGEAKYLSFFEERLNEVDGFGAINFYNAYRDLAAAVSLDKSSTVGDNLKSVATDMNQSPWRRYGATSAVNGLKGAMTEKASTEADGAAYEQRAADLQTILETILATETDPQLKGIYQQQFK